MSDRPDLDILGRISTGATDAFEGAYDAYHERVRLLAWRVSHRADWVDDLVNETWCRAFRIRTDYDAGRPFLVWMTGILRNVYREHCRKSPATMTDSARERAEAGGDDLDPESLVSEAELLAGLNDCVCRLDPVDARILRLRYFQNMTLRAVAEEVSIPESSLRETRIPAALRALRRCLAGKGLKISEIFPAQEGDEDQ